MRLDEDLKDNLRSYITNIIADYSGKDFESEKFLQFLFSLFEQSPSLDEFTDICQRELVDFFGENTENFVNDISTHITMNIELPNDVDRRNSKLSGGGRNSESNSQSADQDNDGSDDLIPDEDDEEGDTNYRREKIKSEAKAEQQQKPESTTTSKPHQRPPNEHKKDNKYQKSSNQYNKKQPFPQGPPPQIPPQMGGGMMPQPGMGPQITPPMKGQVPMMPDQKWPWNPYYSMYPPMGYMPPAYNPVFPYEMGQMGQMMYPHMMPEGKPSEYDPLHTDIKSIPKMDIKPPVKPPDNQHSKRPPHTHTSSHRREDPTGEAPPPTKVHVQDKEGKRTPKVQQQQQRQPPAQKPVIPTSETSNPKTTIFVKNIPDYYNNVDALNKQLKKFGPIVNIKVDLKAKTSMIEFVKPKHARTALSSKAPLFGNKEIIVTGDLDAINEDSNKEAKFEGQLLEKLKFLIEIKKYASEEGKKAILQRITEIKQAQKVKEVPEHLQKLLDYPNFDPTVDFSQVIENVPDNYIAEKNKLSNKLEGFGKLEIFKLNPKTKTLELRFYNLDSAIKAQQALANELQLRYVNEKVHEVVDKITDFEQNYLFNDSKKNDEGDGNSGSHDDHGAT